MAEIAPTREPASRFALRASVLVMMLVSVSAQASAKGFNRGLSEVSHSARIALHARLIADCLLPAQTEAGLAKGIRFEIPRDPAQPTTSSATVRAGLSPERPRVVLLRAELLNLPPPTI